jgi:opacity protein-like surface antigen
MKKFTIIAGMLIVAQIAFAQPDQPPLRLGLGLMGTSYVGDLNTNSQPLERFYPGANLSLQFASAKLLSPQLNAGFGKFTAQDRDLTAVDGVQPNKFVQTGFFYVDLRLKARFLREKGLHPYLSAGIGMLGYTPKDASGFNLIDNFATRADGETYGSISASFPLSTGLELRLSPILMLGLEYTYRATTTDYLDNIGQLGLRNGKDKLQTLMLSLYATFDPEAMSKSLRGRDRN